MSESLTIDYCYEFSADSKKKFRISLDRTNLLMPPAAVESPPAWTDLDFHKCPSCTLDQNQFPQCPVAINLVSLVEEFQECLSYDGVTVTVTTEERVYTKECDVQMGLSPLLGIIMVSSGCPTMELLKPNVRFHLPFATLEEMAYRSFTMYLLGQFYKQRNGGEVDWSFDGFKKIFKQVGDLNRAFSARLQAASQKDASLNALVNLYCMGEMTPGAIPGILDEMEKYFAAYE
ncbi:MAG: hypothetical protein C0623_11195 [Desulfuromonas sp.]|nr:MAG: hypothetical protein C0623_11195 [Desulfuromonas sp.]